MYVYMYACITMCGVCMCVLYEVRCMRCNVELPRVCMCIHVCVCMYVCMYIEFMYT